MLSKGFLTLFTGAFFLNIYFAEARGNQHGTPPRNNSRQQEKSSGTPRLTESERKAQQQNQEKQNNLGYYDVNICLPKDRTQTGHITFGKNPVHHCIAKGKGMKDKGINDPKGDTPTGAFKILGLGGNSDGHWGESGFHILQQWSEETTSHGRGTSVTSDLFIHTHKSLLNDGSNFSKESSWGCPLISQQCLHEMKAWYKTKGSPSEMSLYIKVGC